MEIISLLTQNILTTSILFFVLGIIAGVIKSDLNVPDSISRYLSIYLMMSIGFKGGASLSNSSEISVIMIEVIFFGILISFLQPFLSYFLLDKITNLDKATKAALSAHYGSISIVTFVTALNFITSKNIGYDGYIVAVLALMEAPAILSGLFIANYKSNSCTSNKKYKKLFRDIFTNGAILLLLGSFIIGLLTGENGYNNMHGFLVIPFNGILALFLLDMGLLVTKEMHHFKDFSIRLFLFGIIMPLIGSVIGILISKLIDLNIGTSLLFTILCASASYIAVPAAMRFALPQAKAGIYLPMSLAITFPFNILIGIPLYYFIIKNLIN